MQRDIFVIGGLVLFFGLIGGAGSERDVPSWLRISVSHRRFDDSYASTTGTIGRSALDILGPSSAYNDAQRAELARAEELQSHLQAEYEHRRSESLEAPTLSDVAK